MDKKSNKMNLLPNFAVIEVVMILLLSSTMVIFYPLVSEQQQHQQDQPPGYILKLAKANVPIDIPLSKGYIDGNIAYFIA
ncbi:MAG TPA: hypothetical protein VHJ38_08755, partial [Nitrososphaeraceae archaeon]|nr:hypothetical protein [Nitrososphaeraceae archaeon]